VSDNGIIGNLHDETGYALVRVHIASSSDSPSKKRVTKKLACIDTGASNSCVRKGRISELRLGQLGVQESYDVQDAGDVPYYQGRIEIPKLGGWDLRSIQPMKERPDDLDVLIGNDILKDCTFIVVGSEGKFRLLLGTPGTPRASRLPAAFRNQRGTTR
jgi:hypothetical protein